MKKKITFLTVLFFVLFINSCKNNDYLLLPDTSIVCSKVNNVLTETLLPNYMSNGDKYVFIFYIAGCEVCEQELSIWKKIFKRNPNIKPILIVNCQYPKVYMVYALKEKTFFPTVIYKNYDLLVKNNLSKDLAYLIVDKDLKILYKSKIIDEKKVLRVLNTK